LAAVTPDDPLRGGKPNARSLIFGAVQPLKRGEEPLHVCQFETDPVIPDEYLLLSGNADSTELDMGVGLPELARGGAEDIA
jgi:hypothetical protein